MTFEFLNYYTYFLDNNPENDLMNRIDSYFHVAFAWNDRE